MNIDDYKQERALYGEFSQSIKDILESAILSSGSEDGYVYHLQQIQHRAKTCESLELRLKEKNLLDSENIEDIRNDLAGCRIIFYYNDDVSMFLKSGLIPDNFKVHWDKSKIHGPKDTVLSANDYYTAHHYIIELNDNRSNLSEYARFKGLKCEIQIQTVLNHSWAETAHNITYKKPDVSIPFGKRISEAIDLRLKDIMEKYLKPAGYEFQKVQIDHKRLLEGKKLLDRNLLQEIISCQNNNERYEMLERYQKYTLPLYDDEYFKNELDSIIEIVLAAISAAQQVSLVNIETPYGAIPGKTFKNVLTVCLQILNYVRYVDVQAVFSCLISIFNLCTDEMEQKLVKDSIKTLIRYDIDVLQKAGFYVQDVILSYLESLSVSSLSEIKGVLIEVGRSILDPSTESTSSDYKTFTIRHGSIPGNMEVDKLRQRALILLINNYDSKDVNSIKNQMIAAFKIATSMPRMVNYSDELLALVLKNSMELIDFYISLISCESHQILNSLEHDVCFLYRFASDINDGERVKNTLCLGNSSKLAELAIKFKNLLNSNEEFVIYKTLIGYQSVFDESWSDSEWDYRSKNEYRENEVKKYIDNFKDEDKGSWERTILRCTSTESKDLATFPIFGQFLKYLSINQPEFIFYLINKHEKLLMCFSCPILDGLLKSKAYKKALILMNHWVKQGKYLSDCARVFEYHEPVSKTLLEKILKIASNNTDTTALNRLIITAVKIYRESWSPIKTLFLPGLCELTKHKDTRWATDYWWFRSEAKEVIEALSEKEIGILLDNLIFMDKIESNSEEILNPIAKNHPQMILDFFKSRLEIESKTNKIGGSVDAVPFNFHCLNETLSINPGVVIETIASWCHTDYQSFIFGAARLVANIFPNFPIELENELIKLVITADEINIHMVMTILRNFNGKPVINNVCKQIVSTLTEDSPLLSELFLVMQSTGVVQGEFGQVNAFKQKQEDMSAWMKESNSKVINFATKYISDLEKRIVSEQKQAEESIELRKHWYGDDENKDK